jgi:hypothetical protein
MILLLNTAGCVRWEFSLLRDHWDGELASMARAAMREHSAGDPQLCEHDYSEGWVAGYENILRGGNGDPPLVPPTEYMDPFTRRPSQSNRVNCWHDGYLAGAEAARQRGVAGYAKIPGSVPRDAAMLQPPFYCNDLREASAPMVSPTKSLPAPLPAVLKQQDDLEESPAAGAPTEVLQPTAPRNDLEAGESQLLSPSDTKSPAEPATLPAPLPAPNKANEEKDDDLLLPDAAALPLEGPADSVANSFQRLHQAAATARNAGWHVPLPPVRQDRVAETPVPVPREAQPRR